MKWKNKLYIVGFVSFLSVCAYTTCIHAEDEILEEVQVQEIIEETELPDSIENEEIIEEEIIEPEDNIDEESFQEEIIEESVPSYVGIQKVNDYYVIYDDYGNLLKGFQVYRGNAYILDSNTGAILTGFVYGSNDTVYYCDEEGRIQTGVFTVGNVTVTTDKRGNILFSDVGDVPYFNQKDSRWASTVVNGGTISGTGCAMNVMTSIVNYFLGTSYTPVDMGRLMNKAGYYNAYNSEKGKVVYGTLGAAWPYMASYFGLDLEYVPTVTQATAALKKGYLIAAGLGTSVFINYPYTHEVLFYGYNGDGTTNVYDPNNKSLNKAYTLTYLYSVPSWDPDDQVYGCSYFAIGKKLGQVVDLNITSTKVVITIPDQAYKGVAIIPTMTVEKRVNGTYKKLVLGRDYEIASVSNNVEIGKATISIRGIGNYLGLYTKTFNIVADSTTPEPGTDPVTPGTDPVTPVTQVIQNGTYIISAYANSNYCINNSYASKDPSFDYVVSTRSGSNNQKYKIDYLGDGVYTIQSVSSGLYLTCPNDPATTYFGSINQTSSYTAPTGVWFIRQVGDAFIICTGWSKDYVMNINCEELSAQAYYMSTNAYDAGDIYQKWKFEKV